MADQPTFRYQPENEEGTRFKVYTDAPGDAEGFLYQGIVYETADGGWVADWTGRGNHKIAMPGFKSRTDAASTLYWFAPPTQSFGSRPAGKSAPAVDEPLIDLSKCGCCIGNNCDCEGDARVSQQLVMVPSYQVRPWLIPPIGALVSLVPMDEDFIVDLNTRGCGSGIGYLQRRDDGRYDVRMGFKSLGVAQQPETGMWACFRAHTATKTYDRFVQGFEPHQEKETDA